MAPQVKTSDVFVPGRAPQFTYNPRSEFELEEKLDEYLEDGGSVLALVGPTKTGKSVLLKRKLEDPIWLDGQGIASVSDLWSLVGAALGVFAEGELQSETTSSATGGARAKAFVVEAGGEVTEASGTRTTYRPIGSDAADVKQDLLGSGRVLVIDDFHFIDAQTQREIVRAVKPLVFDGLRVVCAAISHRRHDVTTVVEDMVGRVTPLEITLWTETELLVIAEKGFEVLGVTDPARGIATRMAQMSFGSPHLMQKLCREMVRGVNGAREAVGDGRRLVPPPDWDEFFRGEVEQASERWFTRLLRGPQERTGRTVWTLEDGRAVDGYGLVLKALGDSGPKLSLGKDEIRSLVEKTVVGRTPEPHQITRVLQHVSRIAAKSLTEEIPDEAELDSESDGLFAGVQPVVEYIEDGPNSVLHIADPFFAYYIRWGVERHLPVESGLA